MTIWIVLTDDWELRGNGAGRVEDLQQKPALRLMDLYDRLGIKSTFNVEVMQQLAFEKHAAANDAIRAGRDAWRSTVRTMVDRGFDVQLHLHPQWMNAELVDGWWKLGRRWNIADYPQSEIAGMLDVAIAYLEPLIAPRRIATFRGGSWGLGPPSRPTISELARRGIKVDVSIVNGSYYDGNAIRLDYRKLDCPYLPYRPDIDDVRRQSRSSDNAAPIIEIPTQSVDRRTLTRRIARNLALRPTPELLGWAFAKGLSKIPGFAARTPAAANGAEPAPSRVPDFVIKDPFGLDSGRSTTDCIFDLSADYAAILFKYMADICIERARGAGGPKTVLVLENHTKDLVADHHFRRIENVVRHIQGKYRDVEFKTLFEVAEHLDQVV